MSVDMTNDTVRAKQRVAGANALYWSVRVFLGVLMLAAGIGKALDIPGFGAIIQTHQLGLGEELLAPTAFGIAAIELVVGVWLLAGWRHADAARASAALNAAYGLLLTSALWRGLALDNCGCFGVYLASPLRWYSPLESLALAALSLFLLRVARR